MRKTDDGTHRHQLGNHSEEPRPRQMQVLLSKGAKTQAEAGSSEQGTLLSRAQLQDNFPLMLANQNVAISPWPK